VANKARCPSRRRPLLNHPVTSTLPTIGSISQSPWHPLGPLPTRPLRNIHHPRSPSPPNHKSIRFRSSCRLVNGRDWRCASAILGSRDQRCCVDCPEQVGREVALQRHPSTVQTISNQGAKAAKAGAGGNKIRDAGPQAATNYEKVSSYTLTTWTLIMLRRCPRRKNRRLCGIADPNGSSMHY